MSLHEATRTLLPRPTRVPFVTGTLQRQSARDRRSLINAADQFDSTGVPPIVHDVLREPGAALDSETRGFMETRFGHDFSQVRVHTDERAAKSARAVDALAYTVGSHLVFEQGQFAPRTDAGRKVLSHELAHHIQQSPAGTHTRGSHGSHLRLLPPTTSPASVSSSMEIGRPDTAAEHEADVVSRSLVSPIDIQSVSGLGGVIQRQPVQRPAQNSRPEDFGITLAVVDHGATSVVSTARARLDEIYRSLAPTNLRVLQSSGITRIEMHIIPYDQKIVDLPEFAELRGTKTPDGRLWDDVRGEGGMRSGSTIRYAVGEESLTGGRHGHGAAIGLGIAGGLGVGAGGAALGVGIGERIQGGSSGSGGIAGGIIGGIVGAGLGALGGALLGGLIDESSGYAPNFTASHEGTHTVELFALTAAQHSRLEEIFAARTTAGGPWLEPTDYTSSNIHEYWAQCSAAFFSRPYENRYASSYNPEWLRRNDPDMYDLLSEVYGSARKGQMNDMLDMRYRGRAAA